MITLKKRRAIKRLVADIERVCSIEDIEDDKGYTFGMYIDNQGSAIRASECVGLLEQFKELRDNK